MYNLSLEDRLELKGLLEHNIADSPRAEIEAKIKEAKNQQRAKKLDFSADINQLKKML